MNELVAGNGSTGLSVSKDTANLIQQAIAPSTAKRYGKLSRRLTAWLNGQILTDALLADYITELHTEGKSPATISQVVAAVKWQAKNNGIEIVGPRTIRTLDGIRRAGKDRGRGQVDGVEREDMLRIVAFAESEKNVAGLRDAALIRLMSDCLLRISEAVAVDVERKGVDSFVMRPHATWICAANEMPRSRDRSDAWLERITILPFVNQHKGEEAKRNYIRELTTPSELSGLFNHAFVAVNRVLSAGVFTEGASVVEAREKYGLMNDNVLRFLTENYVRQDDSSFKDSPPERLAESVVFKAYQEWSDDEGIAKPTTKANFRDSVEKWTGEKRVQTRGDGDRSNGNRSFVFQKLIPMESAPPDYDSEHGLFD